MVVWVQTGLRGRHLMFRMKHVWLIPLWFIILAIQDIDGSTPLEIPAWVGEKEKKKEAACWNNSVSTDKYPYHATIVYNCEADFPHFGVIISDNYVLATTYSLISSEEPCEPTIFVGSDEHGNGGSMHQAKLTQIGEYGELSLFKLKNPIKFGPRAQPIKMIEVGQGAKSDDVVSLTALQQQPLTSTKRKVYSTNITVKTFRDCQELLSQSHPDDVWQCKLAIWSYSRSHSCPVWKRAVLISRDRLVAIEKSGNSFTVDSQHNILEGFFNIEYYRALIKNHTGI